MKRNTQKKRKPVSGLFSPSLMERLGVVAAVFDGPFATKRAQKSKGRRAPKPKLRTRSATAAA